MRHRVTLLTTVLLCVGLVIGGTPAGAGDELGPALIAAAKRGDLTAVASLLDAGADPDSRDLVNNTALIFAARDGHLAIARRLLDAGASVDWVDDEKVSALILAAFKGHAALVELLLARGADPAPRDQWGRNALDYALRRGPEDPIAKRLRAEGR